MMKNRNVNYTLAEQSNFQKLFNALETQDSSQIQVFNIPMAEGKSSFLKEYCKFKLKTDEDFAIVIVNKTINECIDTCIDLELKEEVQEEYKNLSQEELKTLYRGKVGLGYFIQEPYLELFNAITLSGFNYKDCLEYNKHHRNKNSKKLILDEKSAEIEKFFEEHSEKLDNSLCLNCKLDCIKKKARQLAENHRILLISHSRLINSADSNELLNHVLYYKNRNGELIKRKMLVIDEKIAMADIKTTTMTDIIKLKDFIEKQKVESDIKAVQDIYSKIEGLEFANGIKDKVVNEIKDRFPPFVLTDETKKKILKNGKKMNDTFLLLENLYKYEVCITSQIFKTKKTEKRELTFARYVDIPEYTKNFGNTILLDATADIDLEYKKSKANLENDIVRTQRTINLYIPTTACNISKSTIDNHIRNRDSEILLKMAEECDEIIERTQKKTLIVTFKSFTRFNDDFKSMLDEKMHSNKDMYEIIHFGQYTTGVDFLTKYENIIFLGQLRKTPAYYLAKSLVISDEEYNYTEQEIQCNEMLVDCIQQIGRTSYRRGITPNVYIFDNETITTHLKDNLGLYFDIIEQDYENEYLIVERKEYDRNKKRDIDSYSNKFLEYIYYKLQEEANSKHILDNQYTFSVTEIKKAIGYENGKNFGRDVIQKVKEAVTDNFIIHDKRRATVTINLEELLK